MYADFSPTDVGKLDDAALGKCQTIRLRPADEKKPLRENLECNRRHERLRPLVLMQCLPSIKAPHILALSSTMILLTVAESGVGYPGFDAKYGPTGGPLAGRWVL